MLYHTFMVKTTLYVPDDLKRALERVAKARGVSEAELHRQALRALVRAEDRPRPRSGILPSRRGPNTSNDAARVDELLAETGFGDL